MKKPRSMKASCIRRSLLFGIGWVFVLQASLVNAGPVDPPSVDDILAPSYEIVINKTVQTPAIPPRPDIVFLADTTGSMGGAIANVKSNSSAIMTAVAAATAMPNFAAAEYRDMGDTTPFAVNQDLTSDQSLVQLGIDSWIATGGGDWEEAQLYALHQLATGAVTLRPNSTPVIVWFGDAPGHDPSNGIDLATATSALQSAGTDGIQVIAINVGSLDAFGQATHITTQTGGQYFPSATPEMVSAAIIEGLSNLSITVIPHAVGCDPLVVSFVPTSMTVTSGDPVSFAETITVPNDSSIAGQTIACTVEFRDSNGNLLEVRDEPAIQDISVDIPLLLDLTPDVAFNELSSDDMHSVTGKTTSLDVDLAGKTVDFAVGGTNAFTAIPNVGPGTSPTDEFGEVEFTYTVPQSCDSLGTDIIEGCTVRADGIVICDYVTKDWGDTTAPVAECVETVNPHGQTIPKAPAKSGKAQNPDGFYELLAEDNLLEGCAPLELFVTDTASGVVFGPFPVGTKIKYTQTPGGKPRIKPMGGNNSNGTSNGQATAVDWHIYGNGDAQLTAQDQSGNMSEPVSCLVPPPPK